MNQSQIMDLVVENALDFLDRSIKEFEEHPKFSLIHFYSAIELFLKARLIAEHWSLVVPKNKDPNLEKFKAGDFVSVTLEEAAQKLDKVVQSPISKKELTTFINLGKNRNKMVHFYHEADSPKADIELKESIAREQLIAWYFLQGLLTEQWKKVFDKWGDKINKVSKKLAKHREYLQTVYQHLVPEIEKRRKNGNAFFICPSCSYKALETIENKEYPTKTTCLVCKISENTFQLGCPECDKTIIIFPDDIGICESCDTTVGPYEVFEQLTNINKEYVECYKGSFPAHCVNCGASNSVISREDKYFCASCFSIYSIEDVEPCEYCGDLNAGPLEASYLDGCVACDGISPKLQNESNDF